MTSQAGTRTEQIGQVPWRALLGTAGRSLVRNPFLAVGLLLLVVFVTGCPKGGPQAEVTSLPSQIVEEFILHESVSGERLYTLEAETAYVYDAEQRVDVVLPRVLFYEGSEVHAVLVADRGVIRSRTGDLVAYGHVSVATEESTKLWTDSLLWNNNTKLVRTDAPVEIVTLKGRVSGIGLVSDAGLSRIEIQSEVQGSSSYRFGIGNDTAVVTAESTGRQ
ncbi:MAG: LPS export ABC transporter periplasmic protein LptC [candidate division WOR-3 bacterium]